MTSIELRRLVPADIEQMWEAWTTESGLARWWWHTWPDTTYAVDATPGGRYRIEAAGHGIGLHGTYRVVERPARLVFSWVWYDLVDGTAVEQPADEVEVTFTAQPDGTLVHLVHRGEWPAPAAADDYRQGWEFVLTALAATS